MLRKVLETIGTRYLVALLNLALIFINARVLGPSGIGLAGIIIAASNIAVLFTSVLSSNTIVYFLNKYPVRTVMLPAYIWSPVGSALACLLMYALSLLPEGYAWDVYLLSLLNSLVAANSRLLLGKDRVKSFNLIFFLQGGLLFFLLLFLYYLCHEQHVAAYLWGMYLANGIALLTSTFFLLPYFGKEKTEKHPGKPFFSIVREMFSYGLWSSADNVAEFCSTRLNYFLVKSLSGLGMVGLLDAGTRISESVWHISRSVSFIEYSEVAKQTEESVRKQITLRLFKFTFLALSTLVFALALIPEWVFTDYLFTPEFKGIRLIILLLSPGIIAFGCNSILSHYFIGTGKIRYAAFCSFTGLAVLLATGYFFISAYGVAGSAISSSISFLSMLTFSSVAFARQTSTRFREFLPSKQDFRFVLDKLKARFF